MKKGTGAWNPMEARDNVYELHVSSGMEKLASWMASGSPEEASPEELQAAVDSLKELMNLYSCAIMEVETKFRVLDKRFSMEHERNPISSISTRLKSFDSIYEKVSRAELEPGLDSLRYGLHDVAGVRVVCSFTEDVYQLAECLERQDDVTVLRRKDYIEHPKPNGYRSLHLVVEVPIFLPDSTENMQVEVQLRTIAMEFWASLEHKMRYKKDVDPEVQKAIANQLYDCAELSSQLDKRMQNVRHLIDGFGFLDDMAREGRWT